MAFICNPLNVLGVTLLGLLPLAAGIGLRLDGGDTATGASVLLAPGQPVRVPDPRPAPVILGIALLVLGLGLLVTFLTRFVAIALVAVSPDDNWTVGLLLHLLGAAWIGLIAFGAAAVAPRLPRANALLVCGIGTLALAVMHATAFGEFDLFGVVLAANIGGWLAVTAAGALLGLFDMVRRRRSTPTLTIVGRPECRTAASPARSRPAAAQA